MENLSKHLEFIESIINRMASNSFKLKSLYITIIAAIIALSIKESNFTIYLITIIPTIVFWILDAYYLYNEKLYRYLYDDVRNRSEEAIDFSMDISMYKDKKLFIKSVFNNTTMYFYGPFIVVLIFVCILA